MKDVRIDFVKGKQLCGDEAKKMENNWIVNCRSRVLASGLVVVVPMDCEGKYRRT